MVFTKNDVAKFFFLGRFSCAAITNSSITFDFHGDRRIWDGSTIRKKLHGNSALYIIMNKHPNGMCCVRTFEYEYDMCTKFSLLFLGIFALQRKFQFLDPSAVSFWLNIYFLLRLQL